MSAKLIDGKEIAKRLRGEIAVEVEKLQGSSGKAPGLAVVLVGEDPASAVYVRNKKRACEETGIRSISHDLSKETSEKELLDLIEELNSDPAVNGILVQLPLPGHMSSDRVLEAISPEKDVDGFHPQNVGRLAIGRPGLVSCTPAGVMELLDRSEIEISGKNVVIIGRSNIVGKPAAQLFLNRHATVTICHSKTADICANASAADIIVAAVGKAAFVKAPMVKEGAVVIDVGINRDAQGLVGDVDFENVRKKASYITPVPGGVGPMTIAMLLKNTLTAFKAQNTL
ncbi:MAG: bifunctional methylenetetrahydrofolate dehydrogenase/methenyltetrahydrofolate cyclohydrolase FolD [Nitrospinota bacterium]